MQGQHGAIPGAVVVDLRHGVLLPQGRSRTELEPVIRDSLRILDLYLHAPEGQKLRRQKRSDGHTDSKPGGEPSRRVKRSAAMGLRGENAASGHREPGILGSKEPKPRLKRSAGAPYYDFGSFAVNPPAADMFMAGEHLQNAYDVSAVMSSWSCGFSKLSSSPDAVAPSQGSPCLARSA